MARWAKAENYKLNDSRQYERRLVIILFFTWGFVFLDRMSQLYLAPFFAPEFHLDAQQIGLLTAVLAISWAVSGFIFGILSDRFGRRVVLIPAIVSFSALSCLSGLAHSFDQLLLARALMGLAEGPCWPVITALIEETSPPDRRGRNVGIVVSAAALVGLAVAPILTTQVAAHFGWRWAFVLAGIPGILISLLIARFVKEPKPHASSEGHGPAAVRDYFSLLRYRNIWLCGIGAFGFMTWLFVENAFAPLFITQVAHQRATTAGWLLGISGLGSFFVGFLLPALSDRVGRKPTLLVVSLLSTLIPIALQMPLLYQHQWLLGAIIFVTNGGYGADSNRERTGPIFCHRNWIGHSCGRNTGRHGSSSFCRDHCGQIWPWSFFVDIRRRDHSGISGEPVFERNSCERENKCSPDHGIERMSTDVRLQRALDYGAR